MCDVTEPLSLGATDPTDIVYKKLSRLHFKNISFKEVWEISEDSGLILSSPRMSMKCPSMK